MFSFFSVVLGHKNICCHTKSPSCLVDFRFGRRVSLSFVKDHLCLPSVVGASECLLSSWRELAWEWQSVSHFSRCHFSVLSCFPLPIFWYSLLFLWNKVCLLIPCFCRAGYIDRVTWGNHYNSPFILAEPELCIVYSAVSFVHNLSSSWYSVSIFYINSY